ncbi:hypothetical protein C8J56DRAFT_889428 [Mycena floridula]|nr:hypothetical protein C8J56DRAFT_889428 [Mycena floridula]
MVSVANNLGQNKASDLAETSYSDQLRYTWNSSECRYCDIRFDRIPKYSWLWGNNEFAICARFYPHLCARFEIHARFLVRDDIATASHVDYGRESENKPMPPLDELQDDLVHPICADYTSVDEERNDGVFLNDDDEIATGRHLLEGLDLIAEDQNWGINLYCEVVLLMESRLGLYDE